MRSSRFPFVTPALILLLCAACASQPDRRGPPRGERGNASAAFSGMAARPIGLLFASMDVNQDTLVDEIELASGLSMEWDRLSSSDSVTALEFEAWSLMALGSAETLPAFITFDPDLDGRFTWDDFSKRVQFEFDRLDTDNSATLSRSELLFRVAAPRQDRGGDSGGDRPRREGRERPR